jgi:hypothetical protein
MFSAVLPLEYLKCKVLVITVHVHANSPRINAQHTSLLWFIFNLHTTEMLHFVDDTEHT